MKPVSRQRQCSGSDCPFGNCALRWFNDGVTPRPTARFGRRDWNGLWVCDRHTLARAVNEQETITAKEERP